LALNNNHSLTHSLRILYFSTLFSQGNDQSDNNGGIVLYTEVFKDAIEGFTPASIRSVKLHTAGELGWEDVGGLNNVKNVLMETLQWPSKVSNITFLLHLNHNRSW
jgi:peroxin-1